MALIYGEQNIEDMCAAINIGTYMDTTVSFMGKFLTDFERIEEGDMPLAGESAEWMVYSHRMGTYDLKALVTAMVRGQRAWVITCTATSETFSDHRDVFEEVVMSFGFE